MFLKLKSKKRSLYYTIPVYKIYNKSNKEFVKKKIDNKFFYIYIFINNNMIYIVMYNIFF